MKISLLLILISYVLSFSAAVFYVFPKGEAARFSSIALFAGFFLHTVILFYQGYLSAGFPWQECSRRFSFYSWAVSGVVAVVGYRYNERLTGLIMMPLSIMAFIFFLNMTAPRKPPLILTDLLVRTARHNEFCRLRPFYPCFVIRQAFFIIRSYRQGEGAPASTPAHAPHEYPGARDFLDITGRARHYSGFLFRFPCFRERYGVLWRGALTGCGSRRCYGLCRVVLVRRGDAPMVHEGYPFTKGVRGLIKSAAASGFPSRRLWGFL